MTNTTSLPNPSAPTCRILVAGDTHGNTTWLTTLINHAAEHGCDVILQLGDFGYWPHDTTGQHFLEQTELVARDAQVPLIWIDGNHENHARLRELPRRDDGLVEISPHIFHAPRGHRWQWSGVRLGALGGAFSIDWRTRRIGTSWWPQETVTPDDLGALGDDPLDVLVTHDAPMGVPIFGVQLRADDQQKADYNRVLVARALSATQPRLVVHGHWHHRYSHTLNYPTTRGWLHTRVEGLASDQEQDGTAWAILDLPSLRFTIGTAVTNR